MRLLLIQVGVFLATFATVTLIYLVTGLRLPSLNREKTVVQPVSIHSRSSKSAEAIKIAREKNLQLNLELSKIPNKQSPTAKNSNPSTRMVEVSASQNDLMAYLRLGLERDNKLLFSILQIHAPSKVTFGDTFAKFRIKNRISNPPSEKDLKAISEFKNVISPMVPSDQLALVVMAATDPVAWSKIEKLNIRSHTEGFGSIEAAVPNLQKIFSEETLDYPIPTGASALNQSRILKSQSNQRILSSVAAYLTPQQISVLAYQLEEELALANVALYIQSRKKNPKS